MASAFAASLLLRDPCSLKKRERVAAALLLRQMRFACRHIRFGRPIESVAGLYRLLGLPSDDAVGELLQKGEGAITDELMAVDAERAEYADAAG